MTTLTAHRLCKDDFHQITNFHWWCESESRTFDVYDLYLRNGRWCCTCPYNGIHKTCKHADFLSNLTGTGNVISPARLAVKRAQARGETLVTMYPDFTGAHSVTNRRKVSARISSAPLPCVCTTCGHENEPDAQVCAVCRHHPDVASLSYSA